MASFSESNPQVDYAGIGVDVISFKPGGGVQSMSGTSMASPHVCGFIAAILSGPDFKGKPVSDAQLRRILSRKYAIDIGVEGRDNSTGVGLVTKLSKPELDEIWKGSEFQKMGMDGNGLYYAKWN